MKRSLIMLMLLCVLTFCVACDAKDNLSVKDTTQTMNEDRGVIDGNTIILPKNEPKLIKAEGKWEDIAKPTESLHDKAGELLFSNVYEGSLYGYGKAQGEKTTTSNHIHTYFSIPERPITEEPPTPVMIGQSRDVTMDLHEVVFSGGYVFWKEQKNGLAIEKGEKPSWRIYAKKLGTNDVKEIDHQEEGALYYNSGFGAQSHFEGKLAYRGYDPKTKNEYIRLYDAKTDKRIELATRVLNAGIYYSEPTCSKDYVGWSAYDKLSGETNFENYIYQINTEKTRTLKSDRVLALSDMDGNHVVFRMLPKDKEKATELWCYDLEKNQWLFRVNGSLPCYDEKDEISLYQPILHGRYLTWLAEPETKPLLVMDIKTLKSFRVPDMSNTISGYRPLAFENNAFYWTRDTEEVVYKAQLLS